MLTREEYQAFRELAMERVLTVKETARAAVPRWVDRQQSADPRDSAFTVINELDDESLPSSAATDVRREDDQVTECAVDAAREMLAGGVRALPDYYPDVDSRATVARIGRSGLGGEPIASIHCNGTQSTDACR